MEFIELKPLLYELNELNELDKLIGNIQLKPLALLLPGVEQQTANRFHSPPFATDEPSHIAFADANLIFYVSPIGNFRHFDRIGISDQRFDDFFNGFLHKFVEFIEFIEFIE